MLYLSNAFSLQMLNGNSNIAIREITSEEASNLLKKNEFANAIGHTDTAAVVGNLLDIKLEANRINVTLKGKDILLVAQLTGGRLPEGTTSLPENFKIKFMLVGHIFGDYVPWEDEPTNKLFSLRF